MNQILEQLGTYGIVPVVVLQDAAKAEPLAEALCKGGLACAEVTFRTDAAEESIRIMSEKFPEMLVGAGTVLRLSRRSACVCRFPTDILPLCIAALTVSPPRKRFSRPGNPSAAGRRSWSFPAPPSSSSTILRRTTCLKPACTGIWKAVWPSR